MRDGVEGFFGGVFDQVPIFIDKRLVELALDGQLSQLSGIAEARRNDAAGVAGKETGIDRQRAAGRCIAANFDTKLHVGKVVDQPMTLDDIVGAE